MWDQTWPELALCAETDSEAFHPEKGGSVRDAKKICGRCDVLEDCRTYALNNPELSGVWGGLSEQERKALRRQARQRVA